MLIKNNITSCRKNSKSNMEDETVLKDVIHDIAKMTGREVSKEQEEK